MRLKEEELGEVPVIKIGDNNGRVCVLCIDAVGLFNRSLSESPKRKGEKSEIGERNSSAVKVEVSDISPHSSMSELDINLEK